MNKLFIISFTILILFYPLNSIAKEMANSRSVSMTVEDIINMEKPYNPKISPDGKKLLWLQSRPDEEGIEYISDMWMSSLTDRVKPLKLTARGSCLSPQWSPDGKKIAFLSDREDDTLQIFIISPYGGEAEKLFKSEEDINSFRWKDKDTIIFLTRENRYYYEKQLEEEKDDSSVFEDMESFVPYRLFSYSFENKEIKRLTDNKDQIIDFTVSPGGKWIVSVHIDSPLYGVDEKHFKKYYLMNIRDSSIKEIFCEPSFSPYQFEWIDEETLCMVEEKSNYEEKKAPGIPLLYEYSPSSDTFKEIPLNWPRGMGLIEGRLLDTGEGKIAASLADGVLNHFIILQKNGPAWSISRIEHEKSSNFEDFAISEDGKGIAFISSTANEPPQVYYGIIEGNKMTNFIAITELNTHFKKVFLARREIIKWNSPAGKEIEGILYYPQDYKEGEKYPLILSIHGGPYWYDGDIFDTSWAYYPHILAAKNSFVLEANYSGSANYGLEFLESIFGHYYELEVPELLSGIDYLVEKGMADPDRLGTMGWSNGSILSIALTVETQRFKVACCGAGNVNWISDYGNCHFGVSFDNLYFNGPYWENLDYYIQKSPLFKMESVTTPTLITFGDSDTAVPTEQGYEHYRILQQLGKVPVRFVLFPGEPHSLEKIPHQKRKMEEELAWFDKYFFREEIQENRSFMKGSPMSIALDKKDFSYGKEGYLGVMYENILIPETIYFEGINVGRFEVTRAQFKEFLDENKDISFSLTGWDENGFKPGTGNYPVSGIDRDIAMRYCHWLTEKTGCQYSLPETKNFLEWLDLCSGEENTLDYWAGYSLTPDEAMELEDYILELERGTGIILPAGFFSPSAGKVYDLNGNVGELCSDGNIAGLYARHISDTREPYKIPDKNYTGFRVIIKQSEVSSQQSGKSRE